MSTAAKPSPLYHALFTLLSPLIAWHSIAQARQTNNERMARQKLGKGFPQRDDRPVWIHMASVGEVNAAYPLILELRQRYPALPVIVSTFTPTGAETAMAKFGTEIEHVFLPLDFNKAVKAFFQQINPRCAIVMETEIWPRLFYHCKLNGTPLLIANGRLSNKTINKPTWVRNIYRQALQNVDQVLARSQTDAERFIELGTAPTKVQVIDNIKFASTSHDGEPVDPIQLPRPYVLAASTHDDEELQISRAWLTSSLSQTHLLVVAPRHPKRKHTIMQQLQPLTDKLAIRSDEDDLLEDTQIYLADTFGELQNFIAGAELVSMGGSLIRRGGQNVIEVARLGKVALFGPHMDNFADERDLLLEHDAAAEISNADDLIRKMVELLAQPSQVETMGQRAQEAIKRKQDVAQRYVDAIAPYLS